MIGSDESFEIHITDPQGQDMDLSHSDIKIVGAIVSYLGKGFSGFAYQPQQATVAGELLRAIEICLGEKPKLTAAGRTDAGVHARAQVVSFAISRGRQFEPERFVKSMNSLLDERISVRKAWIAGEDFNARYSARYRKYLYRFAYGETRDPLTGGTSWLIQEKLELSKMCEGAQALLGEHDFSSFCRKDPNGASLTRRVEEIRLEEIPGGVDLWITASSFCHQMVRSIAGLLYQVGTLKKSPGYVVEALDARDRSSVKLLAPASGLTLWEVGYDEGVLPRWASCTNRPGECWS